jgi:hypothetical protein
MHEQQEGGCSPEGSKPSEGARIVLHEECEVRGIEGGIT